MDKPEIFSTGSKSIIVKNRFFKISYQTVYIMLMFSKTPSIIFLNIYKVYITSIDKANCVKFIYFVYRSLVIYKQLAFLFKNIIILFLQPFFTL